MGLTPSSLSSRSALVSAVAELGVWAQTKLTEIRLEISTGAKAKEAENRKAALAFSAVDTVINSGKLIMGGKLDLPAEVKGRGIAWLIDVVLHYVTLALRKATPHQMQEVALILKLLSTSLQNVADSEHQANLDLLSAAVLDHEAEGE